MGLGAGGRRLALSARLPARQHVSDEPHRIRAGSRALSRRSAERRRRSKARNIANAARRTCSIRSCREFAACRSKASRCGTARGSSDSRRMPTGRRRSSRMPKPARAGDHRAVHYRLRRRAQPGARRCSASAWPAIRADAHDERHLPLPAISSHCTTRAKPIATSSSGPEGTWATIVAINGRDQWRFSIIGGVGAARITTGGYQSRDPPCRRPRFRFRDIERAAVGAARAGGGTYRNGRVFIAGDAAHVMSPTGGFGMNTGIGDASICRGSLPRCLGAGAAAALLDSYVRRTAAGRRPQRHRSERQPAPHALGRARTRRCSTTRRRARATRAKVGQRIRRDDEPRMAHAGHPSRISLRRSPDLLA